MPLWSIIISENFHRSDDGYTRGVGWDENHTLLPVNIWIIRITLAHDDVNFRPWVSGPTNPPVIDNRYLSVAKYKLRPQTHHLRPLITISFPSCLIDVRIFVASEDETGEPLTSHATPETRMGSYQTVPSSRKLSESFRPTVAPTILSVVRGFHTSQGPLFRVRCG
jgi:hypothetical protein